MYISASLSCFAGVFEELKAYLDQREPRTGTGSKGCSDFNMVWWRGKEKYSLLPQLKWGWEKTALSFPKRTHLQHFQFESKYYLRFGIQQQTSSESLIPAPDVWGCWDLELINSATCNFHSDVLSASSLDISYGLEAADNAGLNPNPSYVGVFSISPSFLFLNAFPCFFSSIPFLQPFPSSGAYLEKQNP